MNEKWIDYVIKDFNIITDSGLDIEMKDLIESIDTVEKFDINHNEKSHYIISIELKDFDKNGVDEIFLSFFNFIKYGDINIYERIINEESITYNFFSAKSNKNGFYCMITFRKNN